MTYLVRLGLVHILVHAVQVACTPFADDGLAENLGGTSLEHVVVG
jgi:hypothetical protein